jgi:hypothetical protein
MKLASFDEIVRVLTEAGVHFLVVGGLAVNAHGYLRYTNDVDVVVRLSHDDIAAAFRALAKIDYYPAVPITAEQFADPALREQWRKEKGMLVLKFWSDLHRDTPLDIFVYHPFDFDLEYERALTSTHPNHSSARFASIRALIAMKEAAGRPHDLTDIEKLRQIEEIRDHGD